MRGGSAVLLGSVAVEATASTFILPDANDGLVGEPVALKVTYDDRFSTLAMKYDLGFEELRHANPDVDPWIPGEGARVVLPTQFMLPPGPREGIVINLPEYRLYYFPKGKGTVMTFPIGIGRTGFQTPATTTNVVAKINNPSWYPTKAHRVEHAEMGDVLPTVVPPGPDNPLGDLAIQLTIKGYFLHGTNKPFGVGQRVSHGCVRLYPVDIHAARRCSADRCAGAHHRRAVESDMARRCAVDGSASAARRRAGHGEHDSDHQPGDRAGRT